MEEACRGDLSSFGLLYQRHYRLAVGIAYARLSDVYLAEDAAQEAFAVVCGTLDSLADPDRFPQWLGTICRRIATRMAKARQRDQSFDALPESSSDPALTLLQQQVWDALQTLDDTSREIVLLHYFAGFSYDEISLRLDMSAAAIHGRLQRTRRKLARLL